MSTSGSVTSTHILPRLAHWVLTILVILSVTGCGGGEGSSETTPTNPEPTQPSINNSMSIAPARIELSLLQNYAILTATGIENVPPSRVIGNVGTFASTSTDSLLGLSCLEIHGVIHVSTSDGDDCRQSISLEAVQSDLVHLEQELAATGPAEEIQGDLGNRVLAPRAYRAGQGLEINAGDLILDAQGNADAVWIFHIMGNLRVADARRVILAGGAKAGNIYWRVGGTVQLGEFVVFQGNILANDSIRLMRGTHLEGRAWTSRGSVQLVSSTIQTPGM